MANKQQIVERIKHIPQFVLRDVAVRRDDGWFLQNDRKAVTEEERYKALAVVSTDYHLIQFADVYVPILNLMPEDIDSELLYFNGYGYLFVFPKGEKFKKDNDQFGITVVNSVNTSASVMIKFVVKHGDRKILLPDKISGFKRTHKSETTLSMAKDFMYNIEKVKEIWTTIITKFSTEPLSDGYIDDMQFDKGIANSLKRKLLDGEDLNLWDAFIYAIDQISLKEYKSEIHKRKKLDKVCETIIDYGLLLRI